MMCKCVLPKLTSRWKKRTIYDLSACREKLGPSSHPQTTHKYWESVVQKEGHMKGKELQKDVSQKQPWGQEQLMQGETLMPPLMPPLTDSLSLLPSSKSGAYIALLFPNSCYLKHFLPYNGAVIETGTDIEPCQESISPTSLSWHHTGVTQEERNTTEISERRQILCVVLRKKQVKTRVLRLRWAARGNSVTQGSPMDELDKPKTLPKKTMSQKAQEDELEIRKLIRHYFPSSC